MPQNTSNKRRAVTIHPPARLVGEPKKTKKKKGRKEERKKDTRNSGKLAIRPDHPRRRIKIKLCLVGGLRCVVIHVKCDPNRLRGYGVVGSKMALSYYFCQWLIQQLVLLYKPRFGFPIPIFPNYIEKLHTVYLRLYKPML